MTYRVRNIGIAVALAVVAALLTSFYVTNYKRHVQRGEDHVTVLVAKHDILVAAITRHTSGTDYLFSRVVLRDLKVLQAPSGPAPGTKITGGAGQTTSALLAMTDSQAQKYQWILANDSSSTSGSWHLELRPVTRATD